MRVKCRVAEFMPSRVKIRARKIMGIRRNPGSSGYSSYGTTVAKLFVAAESRSVDLAS